MSFAIGPLPPIQPAAGAGRSASRPSVDFSAELARSVDRVKLSVPASPPPEVRAEVAAAAERAAELWNANRELNFRTDEGSGRIVIEVRDRAGNVIRTIPPSAALAVMAGASL